MPLLKSIQSRASLWNCALFVTAAAICLTSTTALAAPHHGDIFPLRQPDGNTVEVRVWGDEFYQRIESLDGYTLLRDPASGWICYAELASDGRSFQSTKVHVEADPPAGLQRQLKLTAEARVALAQASRTQLFGEEQQIRADGDRDPEPSTLGEVRGITLIIDFSDVPGTVPAADFEDYLNTEGYNGYGNNGSVRDYFWDVSDGALEYTNFVPDAYYRAANPFTYYDDPDAPYGSRARELIRAALNYLDSTGFDFGDYDANDDGYIDAINIFYAGFPQNGWAVGMWPHSSSISWSRDGVNAYKYQITNIGTALRLSTFCHENGHMICFWPDLYDYDGDSSGVGAFCLMCNSGSGTNPVEPCAPLRDLAGWCTTTGLAGMQSDLTLDHGINNVYRVSRPAIHYEYYMIENRQRSGRDAAIPDEGIAIWHVDLTGSNNFQQQTPTHHYFCTLVQADGRWDLEQNLNQGDSTDLWASPTFTDFNPTTSPPATWWDGHDAPIYIDGISEIGEQMSFNYRESLGTMVVTVTVEPTGLPAPWRIDGPGDFFAEGEGDDFLLVWEEGLYTLTWNEIPGWTSPDPMFLSGTVSDGGPPVEFVGTYSDPPFTLAAAGQLGIGGQGASLVDLDDDGDLDAYICRDSDTNLMLRNEGGFTFTDISEGALADSGPSYAAVWADYDNDGDQDLYLARDDDANQLLVQDPAGIFTDVAALGVENGGQGRAVSWRDFNNDGKLDLYLSNLGGANVLFRNWGLLSGDHWTLLPFAGGPLDYTGDSFAATWCDYDADGYSDVYQVNGGVNALVRNWTGTNFETTGDMADNGQGRAATWGDIDADGDFDLYLANGLGSDRLYNNTGVQFTPIDDPELGHNEAAIGAVLADLNNDGALDLYVARVGSDRVSFGDGTGAFVSTYPLIAQAAADCRSVSCGDIDGDGGLDILLVLDGEQNVVLHNTIEGRGHWLQLELVGVTANRDAIGARARVVTGQHSQLRQVVAGGGSLAQNARNLAFGLGTVATADSVIVTWPGGDMQVLTDVAGDRVVTIIQGETTAVPGATPALVTTLKNPWPNPFNPMTTIAFDLARSGPVEVAIYALDGRRVTTLLNDSMTAGSHQLSWSGRDDRDRQVASGTYFCRLRTVEGAWTQRLTMIK